MIYVSIVSSGHFNVIKNISCLQKFVFNKNFTIIVRDNVNEKNFKNWSIKNGFHYSVNKSRLGFSKNNNLNFSYAKKNGLGPNDFFLVMNPDIDVDPSQIISLSKKMEKHNAGIATLNLYSDKLKKKHDNSIRHFPVVLDFIISIIFGKKRNLIDKDKTRKIEYVDWAAGSFLLFKSKIFDRLKGFDENYFMYCEDIDICRRYNLQFEKKVMFSKLDVAIHYARFKNRKLISPHFFWHFRSALRYLIKFSRFF